MLCLSQSNINIFKNLLTGLDKGEKGDGNQSKEQKRRRCLQVVRGARLVTAWNLFSPHKKTSAFLFFFLLLHLQVKVYPLSQWEHKADDVLVMGTDGLWDVLSNQEVSEAVTSFLANCDADDQHRQVMSHSWTCLEKLSSIFAYGYKHCSKS